MILVDTSVWIDHFRTSDAELVRMLNTGEVLSHSFVIGELALGNLHPRDATLRNLQGLPKAPIASESEVLHLIGQHAIYGRGIGYVDAHLLASARLIPGTTLLTRDKRLAAVAAQLKLGPDLH
jgi:predicted nucleic acid-binding protein